MKAHETGKHLATMHARRHRQMCFVALLLLASSSLWSHGLQSTICCTGAVAEQSSAKKIVLAGISIGVGMASLCAAVSFAAAPTQTVQLHTVAPTGMPPVCRDALERLTTIGVERLTPVEEPPSKQNTHPLWMLYPPPPPPV